MNRHRCSSGLMTHMRILVRIIVPGVNHFKKMNVDFCLAFLVSMEVIKNIRFQLLSKNDVRHRELIENSCYRKILPKGYPSKGVRNLRFFGIFWLF